MTPTAIKLIELYYESKSARVYNEKHKYPISVPQEFVIITRHLFEMCQSNEWTLIGKIASRLKEYNCLFAIGEKEKRNNSNFRIAMKGLLDKEVIFRTETMNIYFVNPNYIRRGAILPTLLTTINMLKDEGCVAMEHIVDKRPTLNSQTLAL